MRLRLSDTRSHAEEFEAATLSEFTLGVYEALNRYRAHFERLHRPTPRPHLHIRPDNEWGNRYRKWIDVGYGRGTHTILFTDMMKNTSYLADVWERCQQSSHASNQFEEQFGKLIDHTLNDVNPPQGEGD